jgi:long-chain fatty acid transport protein
MKSSRLVLSLAASLLALSSPPRLQATNGMNLEGYGPVAAAMGGTSMAFDNGTAAVINNPATLGLMTGNGRFDFAVGVLGSHITVKSPSSTPNIFGVPANQSADSTSNAFFMPAFGYVRRSGDLVYGFGVSMRPDDKWLLAADVRHVFWSDVMKQFNMGFVATQVASNGPFAGQNLDAVLYQDWDNQTVLQVGAAYQMNREWTLRFGANYGRNMIPDKYVNCLFPAMVETHLTAGLGWTINPKSSLDASFTYGFENDVTNGTGANIAHRQTNAQLMYSYRF